MGRRISFAGRSWRAALTQACRALVATYDGSELDASLLQAVMLRLLPGRDPRILSTVRAIQQSLRVPPTSGSRRYAVDDGFGVPRSAFVICTFWLIEALALCGQVDEARQAMEQALLALSPLGLLSEDIDPHSGRLWGNFPQAYSRRTDPCCVRGFSRWLTSCEGNSPCSQRSIC